MNCYCKSEEREQYMLSCQQCKLRFHTGCLKTGRPSELMGDTYFRFTCQTCSSTGTEIVHRLKLQWTQVLMLALYNLQLESGGKCGYFRWREHICTFVDRHWNILFGNKKKTNTWRGTVAGTLSAGCPHYFKSGLVDLGEQGWWALALSALPDGSNLDNSTYRRGTKRKAVVVEERFEDPLCQGLRQRSSKNAIQAAIELKERRSRVVEAKDIRRALAEAVVKEEPSVAVASTSFQSVGSSEKFRLSHQDDSYITNIKSEPPDVIFSDCSSPSLDWTDFELKQTEILPEEPLEMKMIAAEWDIGNEEVFERAMSPEDIDITCDSGPDISFLLAPVKGIKIEPEENTSNVEDRRNTKHKLKGVQEKVFKVEQEQQPDLPAAEIKQEFQPMSEYDEIQLLNQLNKLSKILDKKKEAKRLYRKLIVRQKQRELNKPVFDLDRCYKTLSGAELPDADTENVQKTSLHSDLKQKDIQNPAVLDRFQLLCPSAQGRSHTKFVTRLLGFEDDQLESIISPYTMRTLKPFIFRDYESKPPRLRLLQEIQAYPYRKSRIPCPHFSEYPIDYCYVKPHHIPVVNSLCREFFWPGIDLSECLQYPDFSVIAMYRKVVIGFAFMVPDVKYNEAYISFIFTHPEWRNAGIAKFMIYHLIQTCMGKDVTLHVSITNPACFLYQKFGFKVEETLLNFYEKYLPVKSFDCRHALFLRLSR